MDLDHLFHTYHEPLVRYLTRRLGDRDRAEELAQETFVRAMRQASIGAGSERSWLFAVATNLVRDEARREARQRARLAELAAEAREREEGNVIPLSADRGERAELAREAMETLVERDREALLMREEGLDYTEIAEALGLSVGSVGTTLLRARRRLVAAYEALVQAEGEGEDHAAS